MKLTKGRIQKLLSKQKFTRKRSRNSDLNFNTNTNFYNKETNVKSTKKNNYHKSFNLKNKSLKNIF
jgi:hypothetical protein